MSLPLQFLYSAYRKMIAHSKLRWWIIGGTLIYLLSPIDILPDVVPVFGQIDDAAIVALLATEVSQVLLERVKTSKKKTAA